MQSTRSISFLTGQERRRACEPQPEGTAAGVRPRGVGVWPRLGRHHARRGGAAPPGRPQPRASSAPRTSSPPSRTRSLRPTRPSPRPRHRARRTWLSQRRPPRPAAPMRDSRQTARPRTRRATTTATRSMARPRTTRPDLSTPTTRRRSGSCGLRARCPASRPRSSWPSPSVDPRRPVAGQRTGRRAVPGSPSDRSRPIRRVRVPIRTRPRDPGQSEPQQPDPTSGPAARPVRAP